jgi:hypothetical protein
VKNGKGGDKFEDSSASYIKTPYSSRVYSAIHAQKNERRVQFMTRCRKAGLDLEAVKAAIDTNDGSIMGLDIIPKDIQELKDNNGRLHFRVPVDITGVRSKTTMEKGQDREKAIGIIAKALQKMCNLRWPIVGHNIYSFDVPFIEHEAKEYCNINLKIDRDLVIDTGLIIKASQCRSSLNAKESLPDFYQKVADKRSKAKWTLDDYCFDAFNLGQYGVDPDNQHHAGYDCWVNNCLLKELVKLERP